jgi:hypothetical protein
MIPLYENEKELEWELNVAFFCLRSTMDIPLKIPGWKRASERTELTLYCLYNIFGEEKMGCGFLLLGLEMGMRNT